MNPKTTICNSDNCRQTSLERQTGVKGLRRDVFLNSFYYVSFLLKSLSKLFLMMQLCNGNLFVFYEIRSSNHLLLIAHRELTKCLLRAVCGRHGTDNIYLSIIKTNVV